MMVMVSFTEEEGGKYTLCMLFCFFEHFLIVEVLRHTIFLIL